MEPRVIAEITEALKAGKLPEAQVWDIGAAVWSMADSLARTNAGPTVVEVRRAAQALNGQRQYDHTRMLCEAWNQTRLFDATITRHYVQALINLSALDAAERLATDALARIKAATTGLQAASEELEFEGLLGRICKQRFVETGDIDALGEATDRYYVQYDRNPTKPYWHGINAVALRAREEREGVPRADMPSAQALAAAIARQVSALYAANASNPWLAATLSEANLALGECDQAELWLYRFLHHGSARPFDIESYDRQLREIWQGDAAGDPAGCANRLAAIVARHIARTQSRWAISAPDVQAMSRKLEDNSGALEKNFSGEGSFSLEIVKQMLAACSSIGCVCNTNGERLGTGFLIEGSWLKESFGKTPVFVTNAHVISDTVPNAISVANVRVTFEVESASTGNPVFYRVAEVLFTSAPGDLGVRSDAPGKLDVTVVRLEAIPDRFLALKSSDTLPLVQPRARAYVVGHPRGSGLQIALNDSLLLDIDDDERLVHYRTPTDPGSSGSPVFNALWEVIALHHGGSSSTPRLHGQGTYEANEGIALAAIRRAMG